MVTASTVEPAARHERRLLGQTVLVIGGSLGIGLEDIRNTQKILAVVADGRLSRRADLDQLLPGVQRLNGMRRE